MTISKRITSGVLLLPVVIAGCDRMPVGAQEDGGLWTEATAWSLEEEVRIGTVDGDPREAFGQILGLALDDDLNVYVLDGQSTNVRVFDREGLYLRTIGGPGAGPGEFRRPYAIAVDEDGTLWVADSGNGRYENFDRAGTLSRAAARPSHGVGVRGQLRVRDGRIYDFGRLQRREEAEGRVRIESIGLGLVIVDINEPGGLSSDTLRFEEHRTPGFTLEANGSSTTYVPPFTARRAFDVGPDGRVWIGVGDRYEIEKKSMQGGPRVTLSRRTSQLPLDPTDEGELRQWAQQFAAAGAVGDDSLLPNHYPFFSRIVASEDGTVWIYREGPDGQRWFDVFQPTGAYLGEIFTDLAAGDFGSHPFIKESHVAGVVLDDLGVQYVSIQRIHRPE